jgi:hypothetical protein
VYSNDVHVTRLTALAALGIALLYFASMPIGSLASLPASDASASDFAQFFAQHRAGLLVAVVLNGIAWCALMPVAFVGLRAVLGERGGIAATVALVCAGVEAALIGVALLFGAIAAYAAPHLGLDLSKVLSDGMSIATSASAWPTIPCVIGLLIAARRCGAFPKSVLAFGLLVAMLHAITAVAFARSGLLSPSGIAQAAPPAFAIWMAWIGVALLRRSVAVAVAAPAAA